MKKLLLIIALSTTLMAGCSKVGLYSNLPEKEVNEILAILLDQGIQCQKTEGEEGKWNVSVEHSRYADAVAILSDLGRPRKHRPTIDELFPKSGFTSSPSEQRIRLTYGLEQSLESTISQLPGGVINANVHLVLPENQPLRGSSSPSRANVVVVHRKGAEIENSMPTIQQIIMGAVDGLEADNVSVEFIEADDSLAEIRDKAKSKKTNTMVNIVGVKVAAESATRFWGLMAVGGVSCLACCVMLGRFLLVGPASEVAAAE